MTVTYKDGGYGDLIDEPDGRIIDPSGPGVASSSEEESDSSDSDSGGGGGGCFIDMLLR